MGQARAVFFCVDHHSPSGIWLLPTWCYHWSTQYLHLTDNALYANLNNGIAEDASGARRVKTGFVNPATVRQRSYECSATLLLLQITGSY